MVFFLHGVWKGWKGKNSKFGYKLNIMIYDIGLYINISYIIIILNFIEKVFQPFQTP